MNERKIIHFTDGMGKPLFDLPDGEFLRLEYGNGCSACVLCGYCGEDQVKIDGRMVDIVNLRKIWKEMGIIYGPMRA